MGVNISIMNSSLIQLLNNWLSFARRLFTFWIIYVIVYEIINWVIALAITRGDPSDIVTVISIVSVIVVGIIVANKKR